MIEGLARLIKDIYNQLNNLIKLGHVSKFITDDRPYPVVQVTCFEKLVGDATVILPYGMSSALPEDTLGILLNLLGDETNRVFIPISTTERVKNLEKGEVAIGNQVKKTYLKFDKNGNIEIEGQGDINVTTTGNVNVDSGRVNLNSGGTLKKIVLDGDAVSGGQVVASGNNYST